MDDIEQDNSIPTEELGGVAEGAGTNQGEQLPKAVVSKIVERERQKAYEKGKRDYMQELEQQQSAQQPAQQPQAQPVQQQSTGLGEMAPQLTHEDIEKMIAEKLPGATAQFVSQAKEEHELNNFVAKMQAAETRYPGLEKKLEKLNYSDPSLYKLVQMTNGLENTGDVMKDLLDNPGKFSQILSGVRDQPWLAQEMLGSLSNSIKQNMEAKAQEAQAKDPLSSLKPSTNAGMDSGNMSVSDYRQMLRKR